MTRASLNRRLRMIYLTCGLVLVLSLIARVAAHIPGLEGSIALKVAPLVYDYMRDMALVFVTMIAAYLANVFQKRTKFVSSLEEEWRSLVKTKTKLVTYCEDPKATLNDFLSVYERMSGSIDNMRIVYRNVGETDKLIGLYPYSPIHDMRRAFESLDPRKGSISDEQRRVATAAVQQAFAALRETFLEELDLEEPTHCQLVSGASRGKQPGATRAARSAKARQAKRLKQRGGNADSDIAILLEEARARERS